MEQDPKPSNEKAPPFHVEKLGRVTFYEAEKGVDWLSMFPDAAGDPSGKLIDVPLKAEVAERVLIDESPVPVRPLPETVPYFDRTPSEHVLAAVNSVRAKRSPRTAIAASIVALFGTTSFVLWMAKPTSVQSSPTLPPTVTNDRLIMEALGPAVEKTPSPGPGLPALAANSPALTPRVTPTPSAVVTSSPSPRVTPKPSATPRATPTPPLTARVSATPPPTRLTPSIETTPLGSARPAPGLAVGLVNSPIPSTTPTPVQIDAPPPASPTPSPTPSPRAVNAPVATPAASPAASARSPAPSAAAVDTAAVRTVLDQYRVAYESLRSEAVHAVWAGANSRALSRAFDQIASQSVDFYSCGIEINGATAEANCTGAVTFVPKVGSKSPQTESRRWTFFLRRVNDKWVLDRVVAR